MKEVNSKTQSQNYIYRHRMNKKLCQPSCRLILKI